MARKKTTQTPTDEANTNLQLKQQTENAQSNQVDISPPDLQLTTQEALSDCGGALKSARERAGLTIENLASRLRLSVHQIHALETDNFSQLPQPPAVRGFIRNYAKEVRIDAAPIVAAYLKINPNQTKAALSVDPAPDVAKQGKNNPKISVGLLAGASVLILAAWFLLPKLNTFFGSSQTETKIDLSQISKTENNEVSTLPAPTPSIQATEVTAPSAPPITAETVVAPTAAPAVSAKLDTELSSAASANSANIAAPTADVAKPIAALPQIPAPTITPPQIPTPPIAPPSTIGLSISAKEASWVEITNGNGRQVFSKVIEAGTQENISISKPLSITAGNASGVIISYNGALITLNSRSGSKVGRTTLK